MELYCRFSNVIDTDLRKLRLRQRKAGSEYRILGKKGEGTFSEVLKCQHIKDGTYYACKKMKQHYDGVEQVNNLREIQAMRRLNPHSNIIGLHEIIYDKKTGTVALICELMDMNIYEMIRGRRHYLPEAKIKNYMFQLLKSLDHMHRCGIFHRDVKPENILIKDDVLKLADFGSCRSVYSKPPYTEYISTRWYRAPECLLTDGYYSYRMDLWSVGCVFFEVMSLHPLFPGSNEVDQIAKIHDVLGTPDSSVLNKMKHRNRGINFDFPPKKGTGIEKLIPHASAQCIELIYKMCTYDPEERITAKQALRHSYFRDLREAEKKQAEALKQHIAEGSSVVSTTTAANTGAAGSESTTWRQNQIQKKRSTVEISVDDDQLRKNNHAVQVYKDLSQINSKSLIKQETFTKEKPSIGKLPQLKEDSELVKRKNELYHSIKSVLSKSNHNKEALVPNVSATSVSYTSEINPKELLSPYTKQKDSPKIRKMPEVNMTGGNSSNPNKVITLTMKVMEEDQPEPNATKQANGLTLLPGDDELLYFVRSTKNKNIQCQMSPGGNDTPIDNQLSKPNSKLTVKKYLTKQMSGKHAKQYAYYPEKQRSRNLLPRRKQKSLVPDCGVEQKTPRKTVQEKKTKNQQRRQRRLVEQQQKNNLSVKNQGANNTEGLVKAPIPHLVGAGSTYGGAGPKSVYSTTLPKVHLPRHQFSHHQPSSNLLPGILKTNVLQPKTLHKTKIKKEPKSIYGHNHYQLPAINRHVYHH